MNPSFFTGGQVTASNTSAGGWLGDIWSVAKEGIGGYFAYDLEKDRLKSQAIQSAMGGNQYAAGSNIPGAYDYSRFTNDGGVTGGLTGLKGDQFFLLALGAIAVFGITRK